MIHLQFVDPKIGQWILVAVAAVLLTVLLLLWWRSRRRRRPAPPPLDPGLLIDVEALGDHGPAAEGPRLELKYLPVRVVAVAVAPAGRGRTLPPPERLPELFDAVLPDLSRTVYAHKAAIRTWPEQLSVRGFAHAFFRHAPLPGRGGKGSPFAALAGAFQFEEQPYVIGLVISAGRPNNYGQIVVENESEWLGLLTVRE